MTRKVSERTKKIKPEAIVFVMARTWRGRPTLMHQLLDGSASYTLCGRDMSGWSRQFLNRRQAAPLIDLLCCKRCGKLAQEVM